MQLQLCTAAVAFPVLWLEVLQKYAALPSPSTVWGGRGEVEVICFHQSSGNGVGDGTSSKNLLVPLLPHPSPK